MKMLRLGRSELMVSKTAMGCLPIQRCSTDDAVAIIRRAYEGGVRFFDTANAYTDSEYKLGIALEGVRDKVVISTKSSSRDYATILEHIENSLRMLKTDYVDLFQFHMVTEMPDFDDPTGMYAAALEAKRRGWIHHIGVTTHRIDLAFELIESGKFETMQFPFSYISHERDFELVKRCRELDVGFIAMKGLAGGMLSNARACHAFMNEHDNVVPIWGVQSMEQINEWLALAEEDPVMDEALRAVIKKDRAELGSNFCRGCGYCLPCPEGIVIYNAARMDMLLRRAVWQDYVTDEWYEKMHKIENCRHCGLCASRCPYGLDTPAVLEYMLKDYDEFYKAHKEK